MSQRFDWLNGFKEFLETDEVAPPLHISHAILAKVRRDLSPSRTKVFLKSAMCVALAGVGSLFLCPQFGVGFMRHSGLHLVFMQYLGDYGCSIACGAFFSALGLTMAAFILKPEELRMLRANEYLILSALSALSLASFVCVGRAVFFETAILWFLGAWIGGVVATEGVAKLVLKTT